MNVDLRTLSMVLGIVGILQVLPFLIQYRTNPAERGVGWWLLWSVSMATGSVVMILRDALPATFLPAAIFLTNALLAGAQLFLYIGILRFLGRQERYGKVQAIMVVYLLAAAYFIFVNRNDQARVMVLYAAGAVFDFLAVRLLAGRETFNVRPASRLLLVVFSVHGIFFAVRAVAGLTAIPIDAVFTSTPVQTATFLVQIAAVYLWGFGLILMVNQRAIAAQREDRENRALFFDASPDALLITSLADGRIVEINAGLTALTGFDRKEVIGKTTQEANLWCHVQERERFIDNLEEKGSCDNLEISFLCKDGSQRFGMVSARVISLQGVPHVLSVTRDITERKQLLDDLEQQATTDGLTGLTNRRHFIKLASEEMKRARRHERPLALALLDIDHFKQINDRYGHAAGDRALLAISETCRRTIRDIDVLSRFGGDEFALLLPDTTGEQALVALERIREALAAAPVEIEGGSFSLGLSSGLTSLKHPSESLDTLLRRADEALYRSKEGGRNRATLANG